MRSSAARMNESLRSFQEFEMAHERLLDKTAEPTLEQMQEHTGEAAPQWRLLISELASRYDVEPELRFGGTKYGWTLRYRRGGRTLCCVCPERGAVTALVVLGRKEVDKAMAQIDDLSPSVRTALTETGQLHDGRWLWLDVGSLEDAESILRLVLCKRRPVKRKAS